MSFQILKIVLYSFVGQIRILSFDTNSVNIITGKSATGKSALIPILEYCFGQKNCNVPGESVISRSVSWYAVHILKNNEEIFISRRNPDPRKNSSEDIYIEKGNNLEVPKYEILIPNTNLPTLSILLSQFVGISEYSFEPKPWHTRDPGEAEIGKALIYCFQKQGEICSQQFLFHRQGEHFLEQSIKDYMPFFLGAVNKDHLLRSEELRRLKQRLREKERKKFENEKIRGTSFDRAHILIAEAKSVGILPENFQLPESWSEIRKTLEFAITSTGKEIIPETSNMKELNNLFGKKKFLREAHRAASEEIDELMALKSNGNGFVREAVEQKARLTSLNILPISEDKNSSLCPLCCCVLETESPSAEAINANLKNINNKLSNVTLDFPYIDKMISEVQKKQEVCYVDLEKINSQIFSIQKIDREIENISDVNSKRAFIEGRIQFYLESMGGDGCELSGDVEIEELNNKIKSLEALLSDSVWQENLECIFSILSNEITRMAKELALEHSNYPMRIDLKKLTIIAATDNGPLPLQKIGSGRAWVFLHLITHLALHRWFSKKRLPVPRFIFFDQPTQPFYPAELSNQVITDSDKKDVELMFKLIASEVKEAGFQVIITEHANIDQEWFQSMVREQWWNDVDMLVPLDWVQSKET